MRRAAILLLVSAGLTLGLALALVVNGRMAHLRALAGAMPGLATLPGWTAAIDDSAGLIRGSAQIGDAEIGWELRGIKAAGPVWRVRLDGPGVAIGASAVLAPGPERSRSLVLSLAPVTGHVDSAALARGDAAIAAWPEARLEPTRGRIVLDPQHGGRLLVPDIEGLARDVSFEGTVLGSGRFNLNHVPGEDWRLVASLVSDRADEAGTAIDAELRIDLSAGSAALALLPQMGGRMPGAMPAEGVLRALPMPARPALSGAGD